MEVPPAAGNSRALPSGRPLLSGRRPPLRYGALSWAAAPSEGGAPNVGRTGLPEFFCMDLVRLRVDDVAGAVALDSVFGRPINIDAIQQVA